jgi:hypothetical protein
MARIQQVRQTTSGNSAWIPLETMRPEVTPISFHIDKTGTGDANTVLQYTLNNVVAGSAAAAHTVFTFAASTVGSISFPVTAVRLSVPAAISGDPTMEMTILQPGP